MSSKERFNAVCEFRKLDRPPIDYLAHAETDRRLKAHLGCESEEELLDRLGCDFFYLPGRDISQNEGFMPYYKGPALDVSETERTCAFGMRRKREECVALLTQTRYKSFGLIPAWEICYALCQP